MNRRWLFSIVLALTIVLVGCAGSSEAAQGSNETSQEAQGGQTIKAMQTDTPEVEEAKAGESVTATSLKRYAKNYGEQTPLMVRLSMKNLSYDGKLLNVPLFMADQLNRLIGLVLS